MDAARLDGIPLFEALSAEEREQLAERLKQVSFAAGQRLMSQDQFGVAAYVVADGQAEVVRDGQHLADLGAGDVVGEMALFGGWEEPRNATVVASTAVTAIRISDSEFRHILRELPEVAAKLRAAAQGRSASGPA